MSESSDSEEERMFAMTDLKNSEDLQKRKMVLNADLGSSEDSSSDDDSCSSSSPALRRRRNFKRGSESVNQKLAKLNFKRFRDKQYLSMKPKVLNCNTDNDSDSDSDKDVQPMIINSEPNKHTERRVLREIVELDDSSDDEARYPLRTGRQRYSSNDQKCFGDAESLKSLQEARMARQKLEMAQNAENINHQVSRITSLPYYSTNFHTASKMCCFTVVVELEDALSQSLLKRHTLRVTMPSTAPFKQMHQTVLSNLQLKQAHGSYTYNGQALALVRSPDSCNVPVKATIKAKFVLAGLSSNAHSQSSAKDVGPKIRLKLRNCSEKDSVPREVRFGIKQPFLELMDTFRSMQNLDRSAGVSLVFDGEKLQPNKTPKDYDMEDEDLVDVTCNLSRGKQVRLSLRSTTGKQESFQLEHGIKQPLRELVEKFRQRLNLRATVRVRLQFDGEILQVHKTPQDYELENDDLIDVMLS